MEKNHRYKYVKSNDYRRAYVTGLYGGITPNGQNLSVEMFDDVLSVPLQSNIIVDEHNRSTEEITLPDHQIERIIHFGATIPIERLPSFIEWLKSKYEEYLEYKKSDLN